MHQRFKVLPRGLKINEWTVLPEELEYTHKGRILYPVKCSCGRRFFKFKRDLYDHRCCIHCAQKFASIKKRKIKELSNVKRGKLYNRWRRLKMKGLLCQEWEFDFNKFCRYVITLPKWEEHYSLIKRIDDSKLYERGNVEFVSSTL